MGKKHKKFIDKKRDVTYTFKLVPRSQRDPLVADEKAPQFVLKEEEPHICKRKSGREKWKEEQRSYGVYFDDDYDYLQHLKGVHEAVDWETDEYEVVTIRAEDPRRSGNKHQRRGLELPSSLFESYVEEPIGLLNKAAPVTGPRPELDPDIVAELDKADSGEANLYDISDTEGFPDNFVQLLNGETQVHYDDDSWIDINSGDEGDTTSKSDRSESDIMADRDSDSDSGTLHSGDDDNSSLKVASASSVAEEETRSRLTSFSLSSSHLPRTELMTLLDDKFEETFLQEYAKEKWGGLEVEEVEGYLDETSEEFQEALESFKAEQELQKKYKGAEHEEKDYVSKWVKSMQKHRPPTQEMEEIDIPEKTSEEERWDCESILSTYSNIYNHPQSITDVVPQKPKEIKICPKTGMPLVNVGRKLTRRVLEIHNQNEDKDAIEMDTETLLSSMSVLSVRPKNETPEEKMLRKKAVKEIRRERRLERKANKVMFKEALQMQSQQSVNNRMHRVTVT